jgi:hypothetical protein
MDRMEMDERTMTDLLTLPLPVTLMICFLGGLFIGYGYFFALRETANLIVSRGRPLLAVALTLGRLAALVTGFYIAVLAGALALLAAFGGVMCAKALIIRRTGRGTP